MKRFYMLVAVVILSASWASPAQAQLGIGGFGGAADPLGQIESARSQIKLRKQQYSKAKPRATRGQTYHPSVSSYNVNSPDRFGRKDLAGKPVNGYPAIRGDLEKSLNVARGGAIGSGARRSRKSK